MDQNTLRSRQLNPCDHLFWKSRGYPERPWNWKQILEDTGYYDDDSSSEDNDSFVGFNPSFDDYYNSDSSEENDTYDSDEHCQRSNANNPNNDEYWRARGWPRRPTDWRERVWGGTVNHQRTPNASNAIHTSGNMASTSSKNTAVMKQTPQKPAPIPTYFIPSVFISTPTTQSHVSGTSKTGNVTQSTKPVNSTSEKVQKSVEINTNRTSPAA